MFKNFTMPKTCGECKFIGYYEDGIWSRYPHCCCELRFDLYDEDYKVNKNTLDANCPLKDLVKDDTVYEVLAKLKSIINNREVYIMSTIDGKGCHIGKITGVSLDANDGIVIETDIDSVSATK